MNGRSHAIAWLVQFAVWTVLSVIAGVAVASAWVNHDAAWYLHAAAAWLDGAVLYQDVIDTNPPLIVALTTIPVQIGRLLDLSIPATFKTLVFIGALAVTMVGTSLVRRIHAQEESRLLVGSVLLFLLLPLVRADFGQREHLAVLFVTPYVLSSTAWFVGRPVGWKADTALGVLAAMGFGLKPHFLFAWASLELCILGFQERPRVWLRPATTALAATLLAYAVVVVLLVPQYVEVLDEVIRVYGGLNEGSEKLWRLPEIRYWLAAALVAGLVRFPRRHWRASLPLFAVATGFLIAALLQQKGWGYHLYPARVFIGLSLAMIAAGVLDSEKMAPWLGRVGRRLVCAGILVAIALASYRYVRETVSPAGIEHARSLRALVEQESADSLAVLSMRTIIYPAFPVVNYTGARWVMRHHSLWFLPGLYAAELRAASDEVPFRSPGQMDPLERQYFEQVIVDLCASPPQMLVIEPPPQFRRGGFGSLDLLAYYRQDDRFDRLLSSYELRETFGPFTAYVSRGAPSCHRSAVLRLSEGAFRRSTSRLRAAGTYNPPR